MSRITLKGKAKGSELVVGLALINNPNLTHYFWQYYKHGEDNHFDDEQPDDTGEVRSNYKLLEAIDRFADLLHPLTIAVRDEVGSDYDPARGVTKTHWNDVALPDLVYGEGAPQKG